MAKRFKRVLVTGGAGYVGSNLVPKLLAAGYEVSVLDLYIYGDVFADLAIQSAADRGQGRFAQSPPTCSARCVRLRCGHPSRLHLQRSVLRPQSRSWPVDQLRLLPAAGESVSKDAGVRRFIYASSSSVYGIKNDVNVTEDLPLEPLTDYSKYKAMCEEVLEQEREPGFVCRHAAAGDRVRICAAAAS